MLALSTDWNVLHVVDDLPGFLNVIVMQRLEEFLPPLLHIRNPLIAHPLLLTFFKARSLLDIRIADRIADIASFLLLHLLLPHQVVYILLQLRKPVQHYILELFTILKFLVFSGEDVAAWRGLEVGFLSKGVDVDLWVFVEGIQ